MAKPLETKLKVVKALYQLMKARTIHQISVVDVCNLAGISRTTFYSYFKDIFNVEEWNWDYNIENILHQIGDSYGWREGFCRLFVFMTENQDISEHPNTKSVTDDFAFSYADRRSLENLIGQIEKKRQKPLRGDDLVTMKYVSHAFTCLTHKWIMEGMVVPPQTLADIFVSMLPEFAVDALGE